MTAVRPSSMVWQTAFLYLPTTTAPVQCNASAIAAFPTVAFFCGLQVPAVQLHQIHEDIRTSPLQITPMQSEVNTIVRSDGQAEVEVGAQYSIYSNLAHGTRAQSARSQREKRPEIDWTVAYYNLLDMGRAGRASLSRTFEDALTLVSRSRAALIGTLIALVAVHAARFLLHE